MADSGGGGAEQAELAWIAEFLERLGPNPDGRFIMGWTNPSSNLQSVMENEMVQASAEYEEAHGEPFESIEDQSSHADVGYLADLIEEHFRAHGATDAQIRAMYPEDTTDSEEDAAGAPLAPASPGLALAADVCHPPEEDVQEDPVPAAVGVLSLRCCPVTPLPC